MYLGPLPSSARKPTQTIALDPASQTRQSEDKPGPWLSPPPAVPVGIVREPEACHSSGSYWQQEGPQASSPVVKCHLTSHLVSSLQAFPAEFQLTSLHNHMSQFLTVNLCMCIEHTYVKEMRSVLATHTHPVCCISLGGPDSHPGHRASCLESQIY